MKPTLKAILLLNYISIATASSALITPALPQIETFYKLNHGSLEWIVSIFLIGYMLGQLIYGPLANRIGRLNSLRAGLYVNLLGIIICALTYVFPSYAGLLVGRFITALGAASGLVCTYILINESFHKDKAKVIMAYSIISFSASVAIAIFLGSLITQYMGWQYCFALLFIHGALLLWLIRFLDETLPTEHQKPLQISVLVRSYAAAFTHPQLLALSVIVGLYSNFTYPYSVAAPIISHKYLHISPSVYGTWNLINLIGMLSGGFLGATFIKQIGGMRTKTLGIGLLVLCLASLTMYDLLGSKSLLWFFTTTSCMYFSGGLVYSSAIYYASNAISDKASASTVMNFINMVSATVSVIIMGYLPLSELTAFIAVVALFTTLSIILRIYLRNYVEPS